MCSFITGMSHVMRCLFGFCIWSLLAFASGCQKSGVDRSHVLVTIPDTRSSENVRLTTLPPLAGEFVTLAEAEDGPGGVELSFTVESPVEATLHIGEEEFPLYLEPGFDFRVMVSEEQVQFEGAGGKENQALTEWLHQEEHFYKRAIRKGLDPQAFERVITAFDSSAQVIISRISDASSSESFSNYLEVRRNYWKAKRYSRYLAINQDGMGSMKATEHKYLAEIDLKNPSLLDFRPYRDHLYALERTISTRIYNEGIYPDFRSLQQMIYDSVASRGADSTILLYLRASQIAEAIDMYGPDDEGLNDYDNFLESNASSKYANLLENRLDTWLRLAPGQPAPNFSGTTPEGDPVGLTDYRGKVVYIDVWATWCKPCIAEFPHSARLKDRFSEEEKVAFMYVSIDGDKDKWLKYLKEDPGFEGEHVFVEGEWRSEIAESYNIKGIPRYILVGPEGAIIDAEASRPSAGDFIFWANPRGAGFLKPSILEGFAEGDVQPLDTVLDSNTIIDTHVGGVFSIHIESNP